MRKSCVILLLLPLLLEGCKPLVRLSYGITRPKEETPESLKKFLDRHGFPAGETWQVRDTATFFLFGRDSVYKSMLFRPMIYTGDFRMILPDTSHCQWSGGLLVRNLKKDSLYSVSGSVTLADLLPGIKPLFAPEDASVIVPGRYDFIVLATWARFLGKVNERVFVISDAVRERKDLKILTIYLNLDMQQSWNLSREQRLSME